MSPMLAYCATAIRTEPPGQCRNGSDTESPGKPARHQTHGHRPEHMMTESLLSGALASLVRRVIPVTGLINHIFRHGVPLTYAPPLPRQRVVFNASLPLPCRFLQDATEPMQVIRPPCAQHIVNAEFRRSLRTPECGTRSGPSSPRQDLARSPALDNSVGKPIHMLYCNST